MRMSLFDYRNQAASAIRAITTLSAYEASNLVRAHRDSLYLARMQGQTPEQAVSALKLPGVIPNSSVLGSDSLTSIMNNAP